MAKKRPTSVPCIARIPVDLTQFGARTESAARPTFASSPRASKLSDIATIAKFHPVPFAAARSSLKPCKVGDEQEIQLEYVGPLCIAGSASALYTRLEDSVQNIVG